MTSSIVRCSTNDSIIESEPTSIWGTRATNGRLLTRGHGEVDDLSARRRELSDEAVLGADVYRMSVPMPQVRLCRRQESLVW